MGENENNTSNVHTVNEVQRMTFSSTTVPYTDSHLSQNGVSPSIRIKMYYKANAVI